VQVNQSQCSARVQSKERAQHLCPITRAIYPHDEARRCRTASRPPAFPSGLFSVPHFKLSHYRAFASSRSNLKSAGRRPRKLRKRFSKSSRPGLREIAKSRLSSTCTCTSSPSRNASASTTAAGRRRARLLPHFATRMRSSPYTFEYKCIIRGAADRRGRDAKLFGDDVSCGIPCGVMGVVRTCRSRLPGAY
jgi:hypothetical protein